MILVDAWCVAKLLPMSLEYTVYYAGRKMLSIQLQEQKYLILRETARKNSAFYHCFTDFAPYTKAPRENFIPQCKLKGQEEESSMINKDICFLI